MQNYRVSLAAPAYNEAEGLRHVLQTWLDYLKDCPGIEAFEIVICNDGSSDATASILNDMAADEPRIKPVHFPRNRGAAVALSAAIQHTTMDWVLLIDSDGQFPIHYLEGMLQRIASGVHGVIGVRGKKEDSLFGRFGTASSACLCNLFFGTRLRDFNSAFKLVQGSLLRSLRLEAKGLNYSTEVTAKLLECKASIAEADITHEPRGTGKSSMRAVRDALHRLLFVLYVGLRQLLLFMQVLERPVLP